MLKSPFIALLSGLIITAPSAFAQEYTSDLNPSDLRGTPSYASPEDQSWLSLGIGRYAIFDGDDDAWDFRAEYRHGENLFWEIEPWGGAELTSDGSFWLGAGILADFNVAPSIYMTPSVGAGLYAQGGSDHDLGHPIEFRFGLETSYEFMSGHRLGVSFSHMSNAGLDDENPGAETLGIHYNVPINSLFSF